MRKMIGHSYLTGIISFTLLTSRNLQSSERLTHSWKWKRNTRMQKIWFLPQKAPKVLLLMMKMSSSLSNAQTLASSKVYISFQIVQSWYCWVARKWGFSTLKVSSLRVMMQTKFMRSRRNQASDWVYPLLSTGNLFIWRSSRPEFVALKSWSQSMDPFPMHSLSISRRWSTLTGNSLWWLPKVFSLASTWLGSSQSWISRNLRMHEPQAH